MLRITQLLAIALIPYTCTIGIDLRTSAIAICRNDNRSRLASFAPLLYVQVLTVKYRAFFQKHLIARPKCDLIDLAK